MMDQMNVLSANQSITEEDLMREHTKRHLEASNHSSSSSFQLYSAKQPNMIATPQEVTENMNVVYNEQEGNIYTFQESIDSGAIESSVDENQDIVQIIIDKANKIGQKMC